MGEKKFVGDGVLGLLPSNSKKAVIPDRSSIAGGAKGHLLKRKKTKSTCCTQV